MNNFGYTILYVADVNKAIEFYEKAFGFQRKFITPDDSYGELITGNTTLSFAVHSLAKSNLRNGYLESSLQKQAFGIEIGITTPNVEETIKKAIDAGGTLEAEPKQKPWGQTVSYIRDLDGFLIEICTPMG